MYLFRHFMLTKQNSGNILPFMTKEHYYNDRLKTARAERSLSMQNVADTLNVDRQTVYRAENGIVASYEFLAELCRLYDIPMNEIVVPSPQVAGA